MWINRAALPEIISSVRIKFFDVIKYFTFPENPEIIKTLVDSKYLFF